MFPTAVLVLSTLVSTVLTTQVAQLPDTSGIDFVLTDNLQVDQFFSLWLVFNNDDVKMSDEPFTIFAPRNSKLPHAQSLLAHPELVKRLLLDHIVLGLKLNLNLTSALSLTTLGGRTVKVQRVNDTLYANGARVLKPRVEVPHGILVVLDNYLFPEDLNISASSKDVGRPSSKISSNMNDEPDPHSTQFLDNVGQVLSFLKSGVKVFQQFLSKSNVSQLIKKDEEYTVFIPTDRAFQRWHPIDWGFYPFSVPEFTEDIIINHFVKGNLRQDNITDGQVVTSLGGRQIRFTKHHTVGSLSSDTVTVPGPPTLTANDASVVTGDTPVIGGNIMFLKEVMFVTDNVVQSLQQENKDKETAPLLAFPWMRSQFLSHAFISLEQHPHRFADIIRLFNLEILAQHITGKGYTFFVPTNKAFQRLGLDTMPDNFLSTEKGTKILLNHFVKGRLYNRDLLDGKQLHTLGDQVIHVKRHGGNITVNEARVVESDVFVYNLGTMFYIDQLLFATEDALPSPTDEPQVEVSTTCTTEYPGDVEGVPSELTEEFGTQPDILFEELDSANNSYAELTTEFDEGTEEGSTEYQAEIMQSLNLTNVTVSPVLDTETINTSMNNNLTHEV